MRAGFGGRGATALVGGVGGCGGGRGVAGSAEVGGANPGLGQLQLDVVGGGAVSGQGGGDGADLLVAGGHQKGRGPPVALHARDVEARLRVGEHLLPVRGDRTTGVELRIDQRAQLAGSLHSRVQLQPQFREHAQCRTEPGGRHHHVHDQMFLPGRGGSLHHHPQTGGGEGGDGEGGVHLDGPGLHQVAQPGAQGAAGGQLVAVLPAIDPGDVGRADRPGDSGARGVLGQGAELEQGVGCRVPGPDDQHMLTGEPGLVGAEDVRQRGGDLPGGKGLGFAGSGQPGLAQRVRGGPGAGGVDHRAGVNVLHGAVRVGDSDQKRGLGPAGGAGLVHPGPGHRDDPGPGADPGARASVAASG